MVKVCIGVDPGKSGGIAILYVVDQPSIKPFSIEVYPYSDDTLIEISRYVGGGRYLEGEVSVTIEDVHSMPKQGVVSTFNFGRAKGYIEGVFSACGVEYNLVSPQKWKRHFGLIGMDKKASVEKCQELFPSVNLLAAPKSRVPHDGMAEAILIALYGAEND